MAILLPAGDQSFLHLWEQNIQKFDA